MNKPNTDELLHNLILEFLEKEEEWFELPNEEQKRLISLYETIIRTVSDYVHKEDESPVILVWDSKSKKVAQKAINNLRNLFPEVENVSVSIIN